MHGRIKVRTSEEEKLKKEKEQRKQLEFYRMAMKHILSTRKNQPYDKTSFKYSTDLLTKNPDIYTLWNYRKEVILMEKAQSENSEEQFIDFLQDELQLTLVCLHKNPKSYGSWHHRHWVLYRHPNPDWQHEFHLCAKYFDCDGRNFHCWDYHRLIVSKVGCNLVRELGITTQEIKIDFSNYSAWHYRSTLRELDASNVESEIVLIQNAIFTDPDDSSAWFYLRWVLGNEGVSFERKVELLKTIGDLYDIECECKWALIAKCWLIQDLKKTDKESVDFCLNSYRDLMELDPLRKDHYKDLLRKYKNTLYTS